MQGRDLDAVLVPWLGIGVVRLPLLRRLLAQAEPASRIELNFPNGPSTYAGGIGQGFGRSHEDRSATSAASPLFPSEG